MPGKRVTQKQVKRGQITDSRGRKRPATQAAVSGYKKGGTRVKQKAINKGQPAVNQPRVNATVYNTRKQSTDYSRAARSRVTQPVKLKTAKQAAVRKGMAGGVRANQAAVVRPKRGGGYTTVQRAVRDGRVSTKRGYRQANQNPVSGGKVRSGPNTARGKASAANRRGSATRLVITPRSNRPNPPTPSRRRGRRQSRVY